MQIAFPLHYDGRGRTAESTEEQHIRDLIRQVLLTSPGERVNRPTFGSGLLRLVFAPNGDVLANATQLGVQGALQQWLGDRIRVELVEVRNVESVLTVVVKYLVLHSQEQQTVEFTQRL